MTVPTFDSDSAVPCWISDDGVALVAFSTRRGGVSAPPFDTLNLGRSTADRPEAVAENRERLLRRLGLDPARLATAGQVHGAGVATARAPGFHESCDALVTTEPGLALAVTAADCVPLAILAPGAGAAVHAGWRGVAAGMPRVALAAVCRAAAATPASVRVVLGPCIRSCCFEVGDDVAERFPPEARLRRGASGYLDLPAAVRAQLAAAGVDPAQVADVGECTACRPDRYFSHRRDGPRTGRQWAVVALRGA